MLALRLRLFCMRMGSACTPGGGAEAASPAVVAGRGGTSRVGGGRTSGADTLLGSGGRSPCSCDDGNSSGGVPVGKKIPVSSLPALTRVLPLVSASTSGAVRVTSFSAALGTMAGLEISGRAASVDAGSGVYAGGASGNADGSSGFLTRSAFLCKEDVERFASLANEPPSRGVRGGDDEEELEIDGERGGMKIS